MKITFEFNGITKWYVYASIEQWKMGKGGAEWRTNEVEIFWITESNPNLNDTLVHLPRVQYVCVSEIESVSDSMAVMRTSRTKFLWRIEATRRRTSNARKMLKFWCVRIHCADIFFVLLIWPNYRDEKTLYPWHCSTHFFSLCSSLLLLL